MKNQDLKHIFACVVVICATVLAMHGIPNWGYLLLLLLFIY